ncbi:MAG: hypothetical protein KKA60_16215 [Proteobacteria bacterium]|nr:hypothetical protein [Pseudomonadota bacterium]
MTAIKPSGIFLLALFCSCALLGSAFFPGSASALGEVGVYSVKSEIPSEVQEAAETLQAKAELQRGDEGFWSYALSTLIIRFVGIFIVLGIIQVVMWISGRFFQSLEKRKKTAEAQKA